MSQNIGYSIREGIKGLSRARISSTLTISTIAITLTVSGLSLMLTLNVNQAVGDYKEHIYLEAFLTDNLSETNRNELESKIEQLGNVESIRYISKEDALQRYKSELGDEALANEVLQLFEDSPLPASLQIRFTPSREILDQLPGHAGTIEEMAGVDEVVYHRNLIHLVRRYGTGILVGGFILFGVVLFTSIFLISNTLRLTIIAQTRILEIMKLVGATESFIRRPYHIQGLLEGGIGGAIASVTLFTLETIFKIRFPTLFQFVLPLWILPFFLSLVLGYLGSHRALRQFFKS